MRVRRLRSSFATSPSDSVVPEPLGHSTRKPSPYLGRGLIELRHHRDDVAIAGLAELGHVHRVRSHVDLPDFGNADGNARQEQPQRGHRIGGMDVAAGNLQERLKDEEVVAADQFDVDVAAGTPAQTVNTPPKPPPTMTTRCLVFPTMDAAPMTAPPARPAHDTFLCSLCLIFPAESRVVALPSRHTDPRGGQARIMPIGRGDRVKSGWSIYCRTLPGYVWSLSFHSAA